MEKVHLKYGWNDLMPMILFVNILGGNMEAEDIKLAKLINAQAG